MGVIGHAIDRNQFLAFSCDDPGEYFCNSSRREEATTHARPETAKTMCKYICV